METNSTLGSQLMATPTTTPGVSNFNISIDGVVTIDRTFHAILDGHISQSSWTRFCDEVDRILECIAQIKERSRKIQTGLNLFMVLCIILVPILLMFGDSYFPVGGPAFYAMSSLPFLAMAAIIYCYFCKTRQKVFKTLEDLKSVCSTESAKYSNVSFVVREDFVPNTTRTRTNKRAHFRRVNYIDVIVSGGGVASSTEAGYSEFSNPISAVETKDPATRLVELENVKHLVSSEDYESKKAAILASI